MSVLPLSHAILGLGGNVGTDDEIRERFVRAREAFRQIGDVDSAPLYRTGAIGPAQPSFLNTALRLSIDDGQPTELIATVLEIERLLGRDRRNEERWGPRKIDIDVLVWGPRVVWSVGIELPHPRLAERRFALQPLADLVGGCTYPGRSETFEELLPRVRDQPLELVSETW